MTGNVLRGNILDDLIPISRFNKGEANKIFDEVRLSGCKVVVKNNTPTCVLLTPEKYKEMTDMIDDHYLLALAKERLKTDTTTTRSFEGILANIEAMEDVEIE